MSIAEGKKGHLASFNRLEECTISVAPGYHLYVFYSNGRNAMLRKAMNTDEANLPKERLLFANRDLQHDGGGGNEIHDLRHHLYLTSKYVNLEDAFAFAYRYSTQREVYNK